MTAQDRKLDLGIQAEDAGRTCAFCMGRTFRRSRLKLKDVGSLLTLHYPVRCLSCSKRQSVGLDVARKAVPSTVRQVRAPREETPWDGSPWSQPRNQGIKAEPEHVGGAGVRETETLTMKPIDMPDLRGVRLPHVAQMPPGNGENLA